MFMILLTFHWHYALLSMQLFMSSLGLDVLTKGKWVRCPEILCRIKSGEELGHLMSADW